MTEHFYCFDDFKADTVNAIWRLFSAFTGGGRTAGARTIVYYFMLERAPERRTTDVPSVS